MADFVTVAAFTNPIEAEIAKSALEARGIAAHIYGEHTASLHLPGVDGVSGIELRVVEAEAPIARSILEPALGASEPKSSCPICGSEDVRTAYNILHALAYEIIGRSTDEIVSRRKCGRCSHKWLSERL